MTKTSIGVQELRTRIGEKAKADPQHRFWGLYTHVWKLDVLREAYRLAKRNNGAPGVDGVTFEQVEREGVEPMLERLSQELREKSYEPLPCRHVNIPKEGGKVRGLKIPAIRDRVVQGAVRLILEPIFEVDFQPGSYGYRPGRSAHDALDRVRAGLVQRLHLVIDLDLKSYFDTVRHDLLLAKLARRVRDDDVLWLCKSILKASGKRGLPQGSVIGPLWANVFLDDVDRMLEQAQNTTKQGDREVVRYTRFADDLIVLVSSHSKARHWALKVEQRLREELGKLDLTVNEEKSRVVDFGARRSRRLPWLHVSLGAQRAVARYEDGARAASEEEAHRISAEAQGHDVEVFAPSGCRGGASHRQPTRPRMGELLPMGPRESRPRHRRMAGGAEGPPVCEPATSQAAWWSHLDHVEPGGDLRRVGTLPRLPSPAAQRVQAATRIGPSLTRLATPDGGNPHVRCDGRAPGQTDHGSD
jgi:RNA-directed DNA polymerase